MIFFGLGATTVTVAKPITSSYHIPAYTYNYSSYSQQIYTQSMINRQGEITKLRFYLFWHTTNGSLNNSHIWKVYLGHTTRSTFAYNSDWVPIANLTEVFHGGAPINLPPKGGEWLEFILDTPFVYNNVDNLVVAVYTVNHNMAGEVSWGRFHTNQYTALCHNYGYEIDLYNPPEANNRVMIVPAFQLVFPDTEVPVAPDLISPTPDDNWVNGQPLDWILPHANNYYSPVFEPDASGYDVYIDGALVSENQPGNRYVINGLEPGEHTWHVVARNNVGFSPPSETGTFNVVPGKAIGDGSEDYKLPIYPYSRYSYTQSIYLQSEIDIENHPIEKLAFYWNGRDATVNRDNILIYMGHTDKTEFADGEDWIPVSEMTLVFGGLLGFPAVIGWYEIELETPFLFNNVDNLVIAVCDSDVRSDYMYRNFYCTATPGQNRSIANYSEIDHAAPPAGALVAGFPNILMRCGEIPETPEIRVLPVTLDYNVAVYGKPTARNVEVVNMGGGTLNLSMADISIIGPNANEFSVDPIYLPVSLGPLQHVTIPVVVTGVTPGPISATLRITYDGEIYDVDLDAEVTPAGVVIIGDGTMSQNDPFNMISHNERFLSLYTADQLRGVGTIDRIAWDCTATGNSTIRYKIYLKNTNEAVLPSPHIAIEQATLVKQGQYVPRKLGWRVFELNTPFYYSGGNLIVAVVAVSGGTTGEYRAKFSYTDRGVENHLVWNYRYQSQLVCQYSTRVPNIMLNFAEGWAGNDICALNLSGDPIPVVGEVSNYTVSVRNGGTNVQANYQVKLMEINGTELGEVNGPPIDSGAIAEVVIPWMPNIEGQIEIYAKVELPGDELEPNNQTKPMKINVQPAGSQTVTIGIGDRFDYMPMNFVYRSSICESLYLSEELGFVSGTISSMVLCNKFRNGLLKPTKIFLGNTYENDLSAGFIPASEMTLVYDGDISYPTGENNIIIDFQTPYVHTGGNLVMIFFRPWESSSYDRNNQFKGQIAGDGRSRVAISNLRDIDPFNPPNSTLTGRFPQASFIFNADSYDNELAALHLVGDSSVTVGSVSNHTVRIRNFGSEDQASYSVKLVGPDEEVLASVAGPPISSMQSLDVVVAWTPTSVGEMSIYAVVEMAGDEFADNNRTPGFEVMVYPFGTSGVLATVNEDNDAVEVSWMAERRKGVEPSGYQVYRLRAGQEQNQATWVELIPEAGNAFRVTDTSWLTLPDGDYCWAVRAVYADSTTSLPRFSSTLTNHVRTGRVIGVVKSKDGRIIAGATVSNGRLFTTANSLGEFNLLVPVGNRTIKASAKGFDVTTVENVVVGQGLFTTLNFVLLQGSGESQVPIVTGLHGNYPNPFNPITTISYSVKEPGKVRLEIFNIRGQLVRTLINEYHDTGNYKRVFDGEDSRGRILSSGVYFIKMTALGYQKASKMMLMK